MGYGEGVRISAKEEYRSSRDKMNNKHRRLFRWNFGSGLR